MDDFFMIIVEPINAAKELLNALSAMGVRSASEDLVLDGIGHLAVACALTDSELQRLKNQLRRPLIPFRAYERCFDSLQVLGFTLLAEKLTKKLVMPIY